MKQFNPNGYYADELGRIQAQIADLREQERRFKDLLTKRGEQFTAEGDAYRATVSHSERKVTDWKKIATDLGATPQRIRANTKTTEVVTVRVSARSTEARTSKAA